MKKLILPSGAILAGLGVALGAFGAHAFKAALEANHRTETFETAVRYQMYGAFALLIVGILFQIGNFSEKLLTRAAQCFLIGTIIFSTSLYLICATNILIFGAIAPIGGTLLMIGWGFLFWAVKK